MQKTLLSSPLFSLVKPAVLPHSDEVRNIISLLPSCGDIDVIVVNVVIDVCAFSAAEKKREFLRKPPKVSSSSLFLPVPLHPVSSSSCHYSPDLLISCHFISNLNLVLHLPLSLLRVFISSGKMCLRTSSLSWAHVCPRSAP